jgi:hypothetical protein
MEGEVKVEGAPFYKVVMFGLGEWRPGLLFLINVIGRELVI